MDADRSHTRCPCCGHLRTEPPSRPTCDVCGFASDVDATAASIGSARRSFLRKSIRAHLARLGRRNAAPWFGLIVSSALVTMTAALSVGLAARVVITIACAVPALLTLAAGVHQARADQAARDAAAQELARRLERDR